MFQLYDRFGYAIVDDSVARRRVYSAA